ncbi:hypothetical protein PHYBLDRAFT_153757 [Phycomyces blakesleeanus NRRL 1555(-)]|uniref:Uncharacterized protein n=1 Tax=Phycomyces blakesleeanus (strain ATCC 8743b / DSM 1359 / FGSC 10004 / NBRC 33097 / NRRL 1555) TaxID=763407 RepID=A0A162T047_PHYB8|nr:hypothetical protein PHYBLDRAFT_153757 [Phycomyces blakesleeanus NRRL 1555(-)]OAD65162.1 hypothetical protein PHYBLDRAFT_153757 [Phycomyces blakesleeanus NRRL 1555(-)]|eukprot:XP_018283202.1 hypothetical protein PHYBLDRAFT_153757 [Phycomyces blakesleeanus NRRL 1555(-)]
MGICTELLTSQSNPVKAIDSQANSPSKDFTSMFDNGLAEMIPVEMTWTPCLTMITMAVINTLINTRFLRSKLKSLTMKGQIVLIGFIYHVLKTYSRHFQPPARLSGFQKMPPFFLAIAKGIQRFVEDFLHSSTSVNKRELIYQSNTNALNVFFIHPDLEVKISVNIVSFKPSGGITYLFGATYLANNNLSYSKRLNPKNLILAGLIARPKKPKFSAINSHSNPFADGL